MKIKLEINLDEKQTLDRETIKEALLQASLPANLPGVVDKYIYFAGLSEVERQRKETDKRIAKLGNGSVEREESEDV